MKKSIIRNTPLLQSILAIQSLKALSPSEYMALIQLLRNMQNAPSGPYGIGVVPGQALNNLNKHIYELFKNEGKTLTGAYNFIQQMDRTARRKHSTKNADSAASLGGVDSADSADSPHQPQAPSTTTLHPLAHTTRTEIYAATNRWIKTLPPSEQKILQTTLQSLKPVDTTGEITLLAYYYVRLLKKKTIYGTGDRHLWTQLGQANLTTWLAYTLYDKIIDDTPTPLHLLPAANMCLQQALALYAAAAPKSPYPIRFLHEVDAAISKELSLRRTQHEHASSPAATLRALKALLASKSIAHCAGLMIITEYLAPQHQATAQTALRLYCSARQLNDDLHDWLADYRAGQPTYVTASIQQDATPETLTSTETLTDKTTVPSLKQAFWNTTLTRLLDEQTKMTQKALRLLDSYSYNPQASDFFKVSLAPIIQSAQQAQSQHQFEKNIMKEFNRLLPARSDNETVAAHTPQ